MSIFIIIMRIISLTCIGSLLICGLYIGANKNKIPNIAGSVRFHRTLGIVTALVSGVTIMI